MADAELVQRFRDPSCDWTDWITHARARGPVDLTDADLSETVRVRFDLSKARLDGADARRCAWIEVRLRQASLASVRLRGARLHRVDLRQADLSGADLSDASLIGCRLEGADLRGAKLDGARWHGVIADPATQWPHVVEGSPGRPPAEGVLMLGPDAALAGAHLSGVRLYDMPRADLRGAALDGVLAERIDLSGAQLAGARLVRARLRGTRLTGADLRQADLRGADLRGVDLTGALLDLVNANGALYDAETRWPDDAIPWGARPLMPGGDLSHQVHAHLVCGYCTLEGTTWESAVIPRIHASGINLSEARFVQTWMPEAYLSGANLTGADFTRARADRAVFTKARLGGASLLGADLRWASFDDADLTEADLSRADLRGARLTRATIVQARFTGALFDGATVWPAAKPPPGAIVVRFNADLRGADLGDRCLVGVDLGEADLRAVRLARADLRRARLTRANLTQADLQGANLLGADLRQARLAEADLRGALYDTSTAWPDDVDPAQLALATEVAPGADLRTRELRGFDLGGADLRQVDLRHANLTGAILSSAALQGALFAGASLCASQLTWARAADASFEGATVIDAHAGAIGLAHATLTGANLIGAYLANAGLAGATLTDISWGQTRLGGAVIDSATRLPQALDPVAHGLERLGPQLIGEGINLIDAQLVGADLSGAILRRARFDGANLSQARLTAAELAGANLSRVRLIEADLAGAKLSGAQLIDADLSGANLEAAELTGVEGRWAKLVGARLRGARLDEATLNNADLSDADCAGADFGRVRLWDATLTGARLEGVDLSRASMSRASRAEPKPPEPLDERLFDLHGRPFILVKGKAAIGGGMRIERQRLRGGGTKRISVVGPFAALRFHAETRMTALKKVFGGEDVLTGDPRFDAAVWLDGEPGELLGRLEPVVREAIMTWVGAGGALVEQLVVELSAPTDERVDELLIAGVTIGRALGELAGDDDDYEIHHALIERAESDPMPQVRVRAAAALIGRGFPPTPSLAADLGPVLEDGLLLTLAEGQAAQREAVITHLGQFGTERAISPLAAIAGAWFGDRRQKQAARAAVDHIIERQGGLRAGGLSMLDAEAGGLAISEE